MGSDPQSLHIDPSWRRLESRGRPVVDTHARLSRLIAAQAGPEAAGFLAEPVIDGDAIGWRSPHGGALAPADAQTAAKAEAARAAIEALAGRLAPQGEAGALAAHALRLALVTPTGADALWRDAGTGAPVLALWGMAARGQDVPPPPDAGVAAAGATVGHAATPVGAGAMSAPGTPPVAGAATAAGAPPVAGTSRGAVWLPWLVPAALAMLVLWLGFEAAQPLPAQTRTVTPDPAPAVDPTLALAPRLPPLDAAVAEAEAAHERYAEVCRVPERPVQRRMSQIDPVSQTPAPPVEAIPPAEAAPPAEDPPVETARAPEPTRAPETAPVPRRKGTPPAIAPPADPPRADPPPRGTEATRPPQTAPKSRKACQPTWPPGRSPRMLFVVDGSGSMNDRIPGAASRMQAAKRSVSGVVRGLHKDIRVGMVSFSDCNATSNSRYYSAGERGRLIGRVNAMRPGRATSLAASITRAGAMATRRAETVIVVVSDGEDTCGKDPCAAARAVRRSKPNVRINVIDLSGGKSRRTLSCVAGAGGGQVYTPRSSGQMAAQVQRATGQPDASGC